VHGASEDCVHEQRPPLHFGVEQTEIAFILQNERGKHASSVEIVIAWILVLPSPRYAAREDSNGQRIGDLSAKGNTVERPGVAEVVEPMPDEVPCQVADQCFRCVMLDSSPFCSGFVRIVCKCHYWSLDG
jgi:hypothetical protein